ncbi:hypothetical protein GTO91_03485 [Heliobacterium undosum]|uniref:Uncharacterized protein n=1 Tax=Heliomicrobium undosum TaxID=121734 RepID=A0A845L2M6_9FIRM|nr:hypothetical protein [Heliomicrobium undosum]MZP28770.1 hypothetical protein [Heliomicrobium undosum]
MQSFILRLFAVILPVYLFLSVIWPGGPGQAYLLAMLAAILVWPFVRQIWPLFKQPDVLVEQAAPPSLTMGEGSGESANELPRLKGLIIRLLTVSLCLMFLGWWWNMPGYYGFIAVFNLILAGLLLSRSYGLGASRRI